MSTRQSGLNERHIVAYLSPFSMNCLGLRNPWATAWWSAACPGLGHLMLCKYILGTFLIGWEVFINNKSGINASIYYSMLGDFDRAKDALDLHWFYLYMGIYVFTIWDSYYRAVLYNESYLLACKTGCNVRSVNMNSLEINILNKRKPSNLLIWSLFAPGTGYLHVNRLPTAVMFAIWVVAIICCSSMLPAIHATMLGDFEGAKRLDVQWLLYFPSLYTFIAYDCYALGKEQNKLFRTDQAAYLRRAYRSGKFIMPI